MVRCRFQAIAEIRAEPRKGQNARVELLADGQDRALTNHEAAIAFVVSPRKLNVSRVEKRVPRLKELHAMLQRGLQKDMEFEHEITSLMLTV